MLLAAAASAAKVAALPLIRKAAGLVLARVSGYRTEGLVLLAVGTNQGPALGDVHAAFAEFDRGSSFATGYGVDRAAALEALAAKIRAGYVDGNGAR